MTVEPLTQDVGFPAGGGEMGGRIRSFDWSQTPLGPVEGWSQSLKTAVRLLLGSRQPMFVWWGRERTNIYNDAYAPLLGARHPDALGRSAPEIWADIWPVVGPQSELVLDEGRSTWNESVLLIMERNGYAEEAYFTFSYSPAPDDDGGVGGMFAAVTEETQRVFGERQLELLRELGMRTADARSRHQACVQSVRALLANSHDLPFAAIYTTDPGESTLSLAAATGSGNVPVAVSLADELRRPFVSAVRGREIVEVEELAAVAGGPLPAGFWSEPPATVALVPLAAGGVLLVGLNPFRRFDDGYRNFLLLVAGQISAAVASARAHEEERKRAEALAELDRAKTLFFSNVSHELRTPLTLMLGPLEEVLAESADERLAVVHRNSLRLLRLVNTVLEFSSAGAGEPAGEFRPVELDRLTADLASSFGELIARSGVGFASECDPLDAPVYVDVAAWEKILLNLLSNAFKFTLAGEIRVTLDGYGGRARLRVSDTGTGIPSDELPRLFERFHRVRNEQARTYEGTGIGLALVRDLVELHGGEIEVESTVGEGTVFTVSLPFGPEHLPPERVSHEPDGGTAGELARSLLAEASRWGGTEREQTPATPGTDAERVVVVDDNADMRDYLVRLLAAHWQAESYPDGQAALAAIRANPPALVVADVMMPGVDGVGLLSALRGDPRTAAIPVIVVSARAGEESSVDGLEAGADDYLVKPFSARELLARVRCNLELARVRAEAGRLAALEEVRAQVITTISHELRTPVGSIYGAAQTLERAGTLDEDTRRRLIAVICSESERLARVTNDIVTTEQLAAGVLSLTPEPVDLCGLAAGVCAARDDSRAIRVISPDRPVRVNADRGRLQQVLAVLLDNAVMYSPGGADVTVEVGVMDGAAQIVVADCGTGIPADALEDVFRRLYRVDPEQTDGNGGTGLGLYICRELVEAMGGQIRVEPNEPRGSRFVLTFPRG